MRQVVRIIAVLLLGAVPAHAQGGINFFAGDCGAGAASTTVNNACTSNAGTAFVAVASCVLPPVIKPSFYKAVGVLDIQTLQPQIPDWWRADGCRAAGFALAADPFMGGTCATLWDQAAPAGNTLTALYSGLDPRPDRIRFLLSAELDPSSAYDLVGDGTTERSVFRLTVLRANSVDPGACAGCSDGACLVLNELNLQGTADAPDGYLRLTTAVVSNYIAYNAATAPVCPSSVPVRNRTWGALKALYR